MAVTTSRGTMKQDAAKGLGAYFRCTLDTATVGPHTTLSVPKIADVAFDAERFQFWYVVRAAADLRAGTIITSSVADPTLVTVATAHFLAPGDQVTITGHTNASLNSTFDVLTTPSATTFTVNVSTGYAGGTLGTVTISSQFRLITTTGLPGASTVTLQRAFSTLTALPAGELLDFYLILSPDEWNNAANIAIQDKFFKDRVSIPLVAGQTEYSTAGIASWLQTKGQIIRARFRNTATAGAPIETEVAATYIQETAYAITFIFPSLSFFDIANTTIEVDARRYFVALTTDGTTVTLPYRLCVAAVKHEALKLIFQKLGPAAKRIYGQAMVLAERDLTEAEARWLDNVSMKDMSDEEPAIGGNMAGGGGTWSW